MSALYIHIPYCVSKCDYCDFFSIPCKNKQIPEEYINSLCNEINFRFCNLKKEKIETVFIGGGTPSLLKPEQFDKIFNELNKIGFVENPEITVELNPCDITENLLKNLEKNGVNRLSVGIQTFDDTILKSVHRRSSLNDIENALNLIKKEWKNFLSCDLITSFPGQTENSVLTDLKKILQYSPEHISVYSLVVEEETPLGKRINSSDSEYDFDEADRIWISAKNYLEKSGYVQYEISNFYKKKSGNPCKHNLFYWNLLDYVGVGAGGTGSVFGKNGFRYTNSKNLAEYINFWNNSENAKKIDKNLSYKEKNKFLPLEFEELTVQNQVFEFFMMGLRKNSGICLEDLKNRFDFELSEKINSLFSKWISKNYAEKIKVDEKTFFRLTKQGILFENTFLEELLDFLN